MSCEKCNELVDVDDLSRSYIIRKCKNCGRKIKVREFGKNGHGITVKDGEQFVIPSGFLKIAANPLKGNAQLTKYGLAWFAKLIFVEELENNPDRVEDFLTTNEKYSSSVLENSTLLEGFDLDEKEQQNDIFTTLNDNKDSIEWWAYLFGGFSKTVQDAIAEKDAKKAAWAMRAAERCRSMCVFKENLEEVVWMGHSAKRIVEVIKKWDSNKTNDNEEFWQLVFKENPYILSQIFSIPVVFIKDKAYVGGMNIDGQDAKFVDYLFTNASSNDALLVEIKIPATQLLAKTTYRKGIYNPTKELSGSVVQALNYRRELTQNLKSISSNKGYQVETFCPKCVVIIGNAQKELNNDMKRKSFELFRTNLKDVEVITFDELFKKAKTLATLFNLSWKSKKS